MFLWLKLPKGVDILREIILSSRSLFGRLTGVVECCKKTCTMLIRGSYFTLTPHKSLQSCSSMFICSSSLTEKNAPYRDIILIHRGNVNHQGRLLNYWLSKGNCVTVFLLILSFLFWSQRKRYSCFRVIPWWYIFLFYLSLYFLFLSFPELSQQGPLMTSVRPYQVPRLLVCSFLVPFR